MKVAVLLSGHLRGYKSCAEPLKLNLLDNYDCDLFIHTWDMVYPDGISWHKTKYNNNREVIKNEIVELYRPTGIIIEKQTPYKLNEKWNNTNCSVGGLHFSWTCFSKVSILMQEHVKMVGVKYDCVVKLRPDIMLKQKLDLEKLYNSDRATIFTTNWKIACDIIFLGPYNLMIRALDFGLNYHKYLDKAYDFSELEYWSYLTDSKVPFSKLNNAISAPFIIKKGKTKSEIILLAPFIMLRVFDIGIKYLKYLYRVHNFPEYAYWSYLTDNEVPFSISNFDIYDLSTIIRV